jgi:hypothetical protein
VLALVVCVCMCVCVLSIDIVVWFILIKTLFSRSLILCLSVVIRIHGDTRLVVIECEYKLPDAECAHAIVDAILV